MLDSTTIQAPDAGFKIDFAFENELVRMFSDNILEMLGKKVDTGRRTYGFEYEFLPTHPLELRDMERLYEFLVSKEFTRVGDVFYSSSGISITFEPGGQIEYQSPPLFEEDEKLFHHLLECIENTNAIILKELGIKYIGTGYLPNRATSPICLTSKRYMDMHERMGFCGTRGREMMKGTASIHLHMGINSPGDLALYFPLLQYLAEDKAFRMGDERRDIWNKTDASRCVMSYKKLNAIDGPEPVIEDIVRFALSAEDISDHIPFYLQKDVSFDLFLYHMTTIFTDVRLNMKGPTLELRTLDSMPVDSFKEKWKKYISILKIV